MMKFLSLMLFAMMAFSSAWAQDQYEQQDQEFAGDYDAARVTYETGRGRAYDTCRQPFAFCIDRVKRDAEYMSQRDADNRCRMNRGRSSGGASCNTYCSPSLIPPNAPPTNVTCDAICSLRCEVP